MFKADESGLRSWCEIDGWALHKNIQTLRAGLANGARLGIVVKSDAYGHGLLLCAREFLSAGADWLVVHSLVEGEKLRRGGIEAPIYMCTQPAVCEADRVVEADLRVALCDIDVARALNEAARGQNRKVSCHIKLETGTHRQGIADEQLLDMARWVCAAEALELEGLTTHFADIEDTTDHAFAEGQMAQLNAAIDRLHRVGIAVPMRHAANSAAALLWPKTHGDLVRVGIGAYGLWPSKETYAVALQRGGQVPELYPILSWKARIAQIKDVPEGGFIGYGRTFRATYPMRIGIITLGYYEGYDRRLSNVGHVLVDGVRAPVRGRVCMNMFMVDLTHIPEAKPGAIATLLGRGGDEEVSAEMWGSWMGSIHYEAISRIHPEQVRLLRDAAGELHSLEEGI